MHAYRAIKCQASIYEPNLGKSYSGLCLAERSSAAEGQPTTSRQMFEEVSFQNDAESWSLASLLTIRSWANNSASGPSRIASFNTRSMKLDRTGIHPKLVIADGHKAFLKSIDHEQFKESDIIGVIDRNQSREDLEMLRDRVAPNEWYAQDESLLCALPPGKPTGLSVAAIRTRI
ncbi:hypothetical protein SDC9_174791 [bioreactor metagenome]|uniref:Uncharacterized protein n=1 Tax=bioreactor metagenome TaxID=1076179 RepID=A0A645GMG1_9ZZZZ